MVRLFGARGVRALQPTGTLASSVITHSLKGSNMGVLSPIRSGTRKTVTALLGERPGRLVCSLAQRRQPNSEGMNVRERIKSPVTVGALAALALASAFLGGVSRAEGEENVWRDFGPIIGTWNGEGSGFGIVSDVTHEWQFVLQGRFLKLRTKSVPRGERKAGEIHEDLGFISRDVDSGRFVFRQFLSEGFVNTFDVTLESVGELTILFEHRETESAGGMRARMRLTFVADDEYEMILDLAAPGKDFAPCQRMRMKRVQ